MTSRLTPLQVEILERFFSLEPRFFLTGGAALSGFILGHRATHDLDLFTTLDALDDGDAALRTAARELGAEVESLRTSPDFRRRLVRRGTEAVLVDLVRDRAPQGDGEKLVRGNITLDTPDEILANKLCALLSRAEIRDVVDLMMLERAGYSVESGLSLAMRKDAGLTPAQLAWVVSQISISHEAEIPGGVSVVEVTEYLVGLKQRLLARAYPSK